MDQISSLPVSEASTRRALCVSTGHINKRVLERTRTGCRTCRTRKIKCDEIKPVCTQCSKAQRVCQWPEPADKRTRVSRRANSTACNYCKEKKLRCTGDVRVACQKCTEMNIVCTRPQPGKTVSASSQSPHSSLSIGTSNYSGYGLPSSARTDPLAHPTKASGSHEDISLHSPSVISQDKETPWAIPTANATTHPDEIFEKVPQGSELKDLVQLYFSSVHHFGFFAFIHEYNFYRLLAKGKAPRELTLMIIASALRFGSPKVTSDDLARADAWADAAISALLPRVYRGFGAIHLMALLLAQHYDLNRNHFSSAWLLGATCTRMMQMMSLQTLDSTHRNQRPSQSSLSTLFSREALRRMAWSTFYLDAITDGGRWGFHTVDETAFRLQLPCDPASFLADESVITEYLENTYIDSENIEQTNTRFLDMSAYLLRTAAIRRRALHFAFRASYHEEPEEVLAAKLLNLQDDVEKLIYALPKRFQFNSNNMILHHDRLTTFILLHILRHNLYIILGRAALQVYCNSQEKTDLLRHARRDRISHALPIAGLISESLKAGISLDPQMGVQAYVSLEILLFEPRRLANEDPSVDPHSPEIVESIRQLLTGIRNMASRSDMYFEALYRLQKCNSMQIFQDDDFTALRSLYIEYQHLVGQDKDEYDFRDFRLAKLERLRRFPWIAAQAAHDETLLEENSGRHDIAMTQAGSNPQTPSLSPRLDAMHTEGNTILRASNDSWPAEGSAIDANCDTNFNIPPQTEDSRNIPVINLDSESWRTLNELETSDTPFIPGDFYWPLDEFRDYDL